MKESYYTPDRPKGLVYRETFQDEFSLRKNSGIPVDVIFVDGVGFLNGVTSYVDVRMVLESKTRSVRIKFRWTDNSFAYLFDFRGPNYTGNSYCYINGSGDITTPPGSTVYIDGVLGTTVTFGVLHDIVFNMTVAANDRLGIGTNAVISSFMKIEFELFEIYDFALTEAEVVNLYSNSRFISLKSPSILDIISERGIIENRVGSSFVNSNVTVERDGDIFVSKYLGTDSELIFDEFPDIATQDFTFNFWVKTYSDSFEALYSWQDGWQDGFLIRINTQDVSIYFNNNIHNSNALVGFGLWVNVAYTADRDGLGMLYLNGVFDTDDAISGIFDVTTQAALGSFSYLVTTSFTGELGEFIIDKGVWTAEQVSQYYTSTKQKYNG